MEGKKSQPRAILVFGAPCSGKSTFAEQFAKQFKAPFVDFSDLVEHHEFTRKHILVLIEQLTKSHTTLVFEGEMNTKKDRDEIRKLLTKHGYKPSLVWIQTDAATLKKRLATALKSPTKAKAEYDKLVADMEAPTDKESPIVLSGKHTYNTQVKHVLVQLAE